MDVPTVANPWGQGLSVGLLAIGQTKNAEPCMVSYGCANVSKSSMNMRWRGSS